MSLTGYEFSLLSSTCFSVVVSSIPLCCLSYSGAGLVKPPFDHPLNSHGETHSCSLEQGERDVAIVFCLRLTLISAGSSHLPSDSFRMMCFRLGIRNCGKRATYAHLPPSEGRNTCYLDCAHEKKFNSSEQLDLFDIFTRLIGLISSSLGVRTR